jgi:hypothetical protein
MGAAKNGRSQKWAQPKMGAAKNGRSQKWAQPKKAF